ncbi:MAG: cobalamin-binding protein [Caldiserica bacterium]|nr:cobalamin-binding protein [Caldisericota bacterium]
MEILESIAEAVIKGRANEVDELVKKALDEGVEVQDVLNKGLIAGMNVVGVKFKSNEFYVPEVLIAARAMSRGMDIVKPLLVKSGIKPVAKYIIGTVKGDLHDIGKNLVSMMLRGAGFEVIDLGVDVPAEKFVETVKNENIPLLGLSALLTTTMPSMKEVIEALKQAGVREKVKVMVGGAPITQEYADEIEADGYAPDAATAVDVAKRLLQA